jgi:Ca2+-transporting ATPase
MTRPPRRPDEALLSARFFGIMTFYSTLITGVTLVAFVIALDTGEAHARTVAFMTLTFAQVFHLGNARSVGPVVSLRRALANRHALAALAICILLQVVAFAAPPLASVLHLSPLTRSDLVLIAALSVVPAIVGQAVKGASAGQAGR